MAGLWLCCGFSPVEFSQAINTERYLVTGLPMANPVEVCVLFVCFLFFLFFSFFFRVGKSLACHSPAKWCLCA